MHLFAETSSLRKQIHHWRREGQCIAFIPTMGEIHAGHLALVKEAKEQADKVIVSIFTQFMPAEKAQDHENTSLEKDIAKLKESGVDLLFTPTLNEMIQTQLEQSIYLTAPSFNTILLEADTLPANYLTIFTTTICKLFNLVQPDLVLIGENNIQRLAIIKKLVKDLCFPINIISVPTVRESDGIVASRRNKKLTLDERQRATVLAKTLRWASMQIRGGRRDFHELSLDCKDQLRAAGLEPDSVLIQDAVNLKPISDKSEKVMICSSIKLSSTHLIDSLVVDINAAKQTDEEREEE